MRTLFAVALVGLAACGVGPENAPRPGVVAIYDGGEISFDELQTLFPSALTPACMETRQAEGGGTADQLLACFQEIAGDKALEDLMLSEIPDLDVAIEELGEISAEFRQRAYFQAWTAVQRENVEVSDDEVESYYREHRTDFRQPRQYTVWNIFRRYEDPQNPEPTHDFLRELKRRYEEGETFGALAREYSHSETKMRDGLVGHMAEDRLPPRLQDVAAALDEGEVSDPILVSGGAVLLSVTQVMEGSQLEYDQVREPVRRQVLGEKIDENLSVRAAGVTLPAQSVVLGEDEFLTALDDPNPERIVLDISGVSMTVDEIRRTIAAQEKDRVADLDEEHRSHLYELYRQTVDLQLLVVDLLASRDPEDQEVQASAESHLREIAGAHLIDARLREEMERLLDDREPDLQQYFSDNRPLYQSKLAFDLQIWDLPFDHSPPAQLLAMEELRGDGIPLKEAAERLGGEVRDLGWTDFDEMNFLPPKARAFLLQTPAGGLSVPFQQHDALHMIHLVARKEPAVLSYDQVADDVREDYLSRFAQQLAREVIDERLAAAGFVFFEEEFRSRLRAE